MTRRIGTLRGAEGNGPARAWFRGHPAGLLLAAAQLLAGGAAAGDVYVTKDVQGIPIYTDTPQAVAAEKLDIHSASTSPALKSGVAEKKAKERTAEDRSGLCASAQKRYQSFAAAFRLYEDGPNGERVYLSPEDADAARANAKHVMEQLCNEP